MHARTQTKFVLTLMLLMAVLSSIPISADEPAPQKPARAPVKLPGMLIDLQKKCVDLEATICLDHGFLELVACTKGSKEHESIVSINARPMHVHTALLLLGATNGNPAMRKPVNEEKTRWVHLPPRGDLIDVFLVVKNSDDKLVERPISDFISRSKDRIDENGLVDDHPKDDKTDKADKFPHTFLFAGSHLHDAKNNGPRQYLADQSGHVISIATFGDELLCLPFHQSKENGSLTWRVDPTHLPKVGTKVTLRLRPQAKPAVKTDKAPPTE